MFCKPSYEFKRDINEAQRNEQIADYQAKKHRFKEPYDEIRIKSILNRMILDGSFPAIKYELYDDDNLGEMVNRLYKQLQGSGDANPLSTNEIRAHALKFQYAFANHACQKNLVALHEACHIIAARHLEYTIMSATCRRGADSGGSTHFTWNQTAAKGESDFCEDNIIISLAPFAFSRVRNPIIPLPSTPGTIGGDNGDMQKATSFAARLALLSGNTIDSCLTKGYQQAVSIMSQRTSEIDRIRCQLFTNVSMNAIEMNMQFAAIKMKDTSL